MAKNLLRKIRLPIAVALLAALLLTFGITGCTQREIQSLTLDSASTYRTEYAIGEAFDPAGIKLLVLYKGEIGTETVVLSEVWREVQVTGFETTSEGERVALIHYRGATVDFPYTVTETVGSTVEYTVHFETNGGSRVPDARVGEFGAVVMPSDPVRDGYAFEGWYKNSSFADAWDFGVDRVTGDTTLYAKWAVLHTIIFLAPDADEPVREDNPIVRYVKHGGDLVNVPEVPAKVGKTGSWGRTFTNIVSDLRVYAIYTTRTFRVRFLDYKDSGEMVLIGGEEFDVPYGTKLFDEESDFYINHFNNFPTPNNRAHRHFVGWDVPGLGAEQALEDYEVTEPVDIVARYELDEHVVKFWSNLDGEGDEPYATVTVPYGTIIPAEPEQKEDFAKENYRFDAWYTRQNRKWNFKSDAVVEDLDLDAHWVRQYTLTFYSKEKGTEENEILYGPLSVDEGATLTASDLTPYIVPEREGYAGKWDVVSFQNIRANMDIYPEYEILKFTVRFQMPDGELIREDSGVAYGTELVPPTEEEISTKLQELGVSEKYRGQEFKSWDGVNDEGKLQVTQDETVIAHYEEKRFTVRFVDTEGHVFSQAEYPYGGRVTEPQPPVRDKFRFMGWYKDDTFQVAWNFLVDVVTEDTDIYAQLDREWTVTFKGTDSDGNDIDVSLTILQGGYLREEDVPEPPHTKQELYEWRDQYGNSPNYGAPVSDDLNFTGTPTTNPRYYTVQFRIGTETVLSESREYGEEVPLPSEESILAKTPQGYRFERWSPEVVEGMTVERDLLFEGVISIKTYRVRFVSRDFKEEEGRITEGTVFDEKTVEHGQSAPLPPTREDSPWITQYPDMVFSGWSGGDNRNITADTDFRASYTPIMCRVRFMDEATNELYAEYQIKKGETLTKFPADPTKEGYDFLKWTGGAIDGVINQDITFYATWAKKKFTIKFEINLEGYTVDPIEPVEVEYGERLSAPEKDPEMAGKAFLGWYKDARISVRYDFLSAVVESFTLYAGWADYVDGTSGLAYRLLSDESGYEVVNNEKGTGELSEIQIPNYYLGKAVVSIGPGAFRNHTKLKKIVLPGTILRIAPGAFYGCTALTESGLEEGVFRIGASITSIGTSAFEGSGLEQVVFEPRDASQEYTISDYAFAYCSALRQIELPIGLTSVGKSAFAYDAALRTVVLPEGLLVLGADAFKRCDNLKYVRMEAIRVVPRMEANAFTETSETLHIYVPNLSDYTRSWTIEEVQARLYSTANISADGNWAYAYTAGNTALTLVQYLGMEKEVTIPSTLRIYELDSETSGRIERTLRVTGVGAYAFDSGEEKISFDPTLTLSENTFTGARNLLYIGLIFPDHDGAAGETAAKAISAAFSRLERLCELGVDGVTQDTEWTLRTFFGGQPPASLKKITVTADASALPLYVANNMFERCPSIEQVTIGSGIRAIGESVFANDTALNTVIFEGALEAIGASAFENSRELGALDIPNTVTEIGRYAFQNTAYWTACASGENPYMIVGDSILYAYFGKDVILEMPDEIKRVTPYAFYGNTAIRGVVFQEGSNLTLIGDYAFANTGNLEYVVLPQGLTNPGNFVFQGATKLKTAIFFVSDSGVWNSWAASGDFQGNNYFESSAKTRVYARGSSEHTTLFGESVVLEFGLDLKYNALGDDWIVATGSNGYRGIQYIGTYESDKELTVAVNNTVSYLEPYAFPRATTAIEVPSFAPLREGSGQRSGLSKEAYYGLTKLTKLTIRAFSATYASGDVYQYLFQNNKNLTELVLGGEYGGNVQLTDLLGGVYAQLTKVQILGAEGNVKGVQSLCTGMFAGYTQLRDIVLPEEGIPTIAMNVFDGTAWLENWKDTEHPGCDDFVTIFDGLLVAYKGDAKLITLPEHITKINTGTFYENTDIEVLILPKAVEIGNYAFDGASNLNLVILRENLTQVGESAFRAGSDCATMFLPSTAAESDLTTPISAWRWKGVVESGDPEYLGIAVNGSTEGGLQNIALALRTEDETVKILKYLIEGAIAYPDDPLASARALGCAFGATDRAAYVDEGGLPVTVASYGANVVYTSVTYLKISLKSDFDDNAFHNAVGIKTLELVDTAGATYRMKSAFAKDLFGQSTNLAEIVYAGDAQLSLLLAGEVPASVTTVRIPEGNVKLANYALRNFKAVSNVVLPLSMTDAGVYALEDTAFYARQGSFVVFPSGLLYKYTQTMVSNPSMPTSIKIIGSYAFATFKPNDNASWVEGGSNGTWDGNTAVKEVQFTLGSSATQIRAYAFYGMRNLGYLDIPDSMTTVDPKAFEESGISYDENGVLSFTGNHSLGSILVHYRGTESEFNITREYKRVLFGAFKGLSTLKSVVFEDTEYTVLVCDEAFANCTGLNSVTFHSRITFGANVFDGTNNVEKWLMSDGVGGTSDLMAKEDGTTLDYVVVNGTLLRYLGNHVETWTLPENVVTIATGAFALDLDNDPTQVRVERLIVTASVPATLQDNALNFVGKIEVPQDALATYQREWSAYAEKLVTAES